MKLRHRGKCRTENTAALSVITLMAELPSGYILYSSRLIQALEKLIHLRLAMIIRGQNPAKKYPEALITFNMYISDKLPRLPPHQSLLSL